MIKAVLSIRGLKCWAESVVQRRPAMITVIECKPCRRNSSVQNWVEILADFNMLDALAGEIKGHDQVVEVDVVRSRSGMLGVVKTRKCPIWIAMKGLSCIARSHVVKPDGSSDLTVLTSGRNSLKQLLERLYDEEVEAKVLKITSMIDGDPITARQKHIVRLAFENGYFEYPRKIRQRELAEICRVSSSTLSELLRRAEKSIVKEYLEKTAPKRLELELSPYPEYAREKI